MDIVSKFKGQGIKIETTKSRHELFNSLLNSGFAMINHNFVQLKQEMAPVMEKPLKIKNS